MRLLMIAAAGTVASIGTSIAVWGALQAERHWVRHYELVEDRLVLTNVRSFLVNEAAETALKAVCDTPPDDEGFFPFGVTHEAWFKGPDPFGRTCERMSRVVYTRSDAQGRVGRVEVLRDEKDATYIFVEHESEATRAAIARLIAARLASEGVREW